MRQAATSAVISVSHPLISFLGFSPMFSLPWLQIPDLFAFFIELPNDQHWRVASVFYCYSPSYDRVKASSFLFNLL